MTTSENLNTALEAGAADFVRKPIDEIELIARVNSMLFLSESYKKIKNQKEEIRLQHDILARQNEQITHSLNYARKIQAAVLSSDERIEEILSQYFILFKPRDIVSGDFYWIRRVNKYLLVATADCTGHGVPGGFLSMLGVSFLNEIVRKREITQANQVLDKLRERVKTTLDQTGKLDEATDGMDIALYIIDTETNKLQFSGANNTLYIYRNKQLIEFEGDDQPIGIYEQEHPFTYHEIQLEKGDAIYSYTDGYVDQFGGNNSGKFLSKRLKKILLNIQDKKMSEQKLLLEKAFNKWKGEKKQIDDMLVVGIKL
jgi:serine phosphatase RsbU (regulator of sigma subunit)